MRTSFWRQTNATFAFSSSHPYALKHRTLNLSRINCIEMQNTEMLNSMIDQILHKKRFSISWGSVSMRHWTEVSVYRVHALLSELPVKKNICKQIPVRNYWKQAWSARDIYKLVVVWLYLCPSPWSTALCVQNHVWLRKLCPHRFREKHAESITPNNNSPFKI